MKNFLQTITSSALSILFAIVVVSGTVYFVSKEGARLLSAEITILNVEQINSIRGVTFASPSGSSYAINNVVTISSYFIRHTALFFNENDYISGANIENSTIFLSQGSIPCPAGTTYTSNQIILPNNFAGSCTVGVSIPGFPNINEDDGVFPALDGTNELTIEAAPSCSELQTSIVLGQGSGFENIDPADLGTFASTIFPFDFNAVTPITSITLDYPTTTVEGAQTFQIQLNFVPDISIDPINGIASRAEVVLNSGGGIYEILVRDEGDDNRVGTASNFAYVFNDLLGYNSPFTAFIDVLPGEIELQAKQMGIFPNLGYACSTNGIPPLQCFAGGSDGVNEGLGVLAVPLTLNNDIVQGNTSIVFASGSAGEVEWTSSDSSLLEVTTLAEAAQDGGSSVDFSDVLLGAPAIEDVDYLIADGASYNITNCNKVFDDLDVFQNESCTVEVSIPVNYDITGINYTADVSLEDAVIEVGVQGATLNGILTASGTWTTGGGFSASATGSVVGVVSGSVAGLYSGTVSGQISSNISVSITADPFAGATELTASGFQGRITAAGIPVAIEGILTDVPGSFTSTVKNQNSDNSYLALLYPKRAGTSILSAIDANGCIATFNVNIIAKQVMLEPVGFDSGDVLEVAETIQINAFVGAANQELQEYENISASSGIEWFSSNEEVATVDGTGLLTALKPGVTNITARYDTGETEIGTIESQPLTITVNKISQLRLTFDDVTESMLNSSVVEAAHESVVIAINNPEAAGQTIVIEGRSIPIVLPVATYTNDLAKIQAMIEDPITGLLTTLAVQTPALLPLITVSQVEGYPGMLIIQATTEQDTDINADNVIDIDENGIVDVDTTALELDAMILPSYNSTISLPASETYGLRVLAQYDNGSTKLLPPTDFTWVNTPVNYLEQASLDAGLLKFGEIAGVSTLIAQFLNADASVVQSNYLTVEVQSGPVIEYAYRVGTGPIEKGSRILLHTKITDVDTISDITSIETSIVYSTENTYTGITGDAAAIWFTAENFLNEVVVTESSEDAEAAPVVTSLPYKIYDIPVEIPVDENLFDGLYNLILSITDAAGHTLNYVYPIRVGAIGEGDVNGDGTTNMIDVIIAFQIATGGIPNPTAAQLQAANVDGMGGVTLIDVIILFNLVNS